MKHLMISDKSLVVGDEVADALIDYATLIAGTGRADNVTLQAIAADGASVEATILLDSGTNLVSESVDSRAEEPDNAAAVHELKQRIAALRDGTGGESPRSLGEWGDY
jgi:hypothetical protein